MEAGERGSSGAGWAVFSLVGVAGWIGATVVAAVNAEDPSDPEPILRTFALAGGVFFGLILGAAALQVRRSGSRVNERLYRRLALGEVPPRVLRAAVRGARRVGYVYLLFAAMTTFLALAAIGLGPDGPTAALYYAAGVLVLGWLVYMVYALSRSYQGSNDVLAPLGLAIATLPTWVPTSGGGVLAGALSFSGERHGRAVAIAQRTRTALTTVQGEFAKRKLTSPDSMAAVTGEPARFYRRVEAKVGRDGVSVRRSGNSAGRYMFHDLLLAECLAGQVRDHP